MSQDGVGITYRSRHGGMWLSFAACNCVTWSESLRSSRPQFLLSNRNSGITPVFVLGRWLPPGLSKVLQMPDSLHGGGG